MKEVKLRSGNALKISEVPFAEAKALNQVLMREIRGVKFSGKEEFGELMKNLFAIGLSSPAIDQELWNVFKRVQYCDKRGELKIDKDTFESAEARADYVEVCRAVIEEVCGPFLNGLYVEFKTLFEKIAPYLG